MKKRFWTATLALVLALLLVFALVACDNGNGNNEDDNSDGKQELVPTKELKYELTEDGSGFCVTGIESVDITKLVIPSTYLTKPVVAIADKAFFSCVLLESIVIPDSVVSIGKQAFENTAYYEKINNWKSRVLYIGKHLIEAKTDIEGEYWVNSGTVAIADEAFDSCKKLSAVTIGDNVVNVGTSAFSECTALKSVTIGNAVKTISKWAFYGCSALETINMGNSVTTIGQQAFQNCGKIKSIELPATLKTVGMWAFDKCTSLSDVYLHDIGAWCGVDFPIDAAANPFHYANNLYLNGELVTEIVIPNGVTAINRCVFEGLKTLTKVTIPVTVTKIGMQAFKNCTSLTNITFRGTLNEWRHIDTTNNGYGWRWDENVEDYKVYCNDGYYEKYGGYHYY